MNLQPGEIWLADLGLAAKTRPVVIISRHDPDAPRALAIYVPLTTQNRNSPYEVAIPKLGFLNAISVANVQGIASIPMIRLEIRNIAGNGHGGDQARSVLRFEFALPPDSRCLSSHRPKPT